MTEQPGIYAIRHTASGRVYVGSASNISKRWSRHRKDLADGEHRNAHLQAAWSAYGAEAFEFVVLEITGNLDEREQHWMDELRAVENGFNLCPVARSSRGRAWSLEERASRLAAGPLDRYLNSPEALARRVHIIAERGRRSRKLTMDQAREIRALRSRNPRPTLAALSTEFGLSPGSLSELVNGKSYREEVVPS